MKVPYVNLGLQAEPFKKQLLEKCEKVISSGHYILGEEVKTFEANFSQYCGTKYALGVANGTSALYLVLKALGLKPGDEVITAPNSFIASASAIALAGLRPIFADIDEDFNIDPASIEAAITPKTRALMPVHLTGRLARMPEILKIAKKHELFVLEDAAQAVAASFEGRRAGAWGNAAGFSCHPLKNLHAFGDAGMITTNDSRLYERLTRERNLGLKSRDECEFWGFNERLDELQAAFLNVQFERLDETTEERRKIGKFYNDSLRECVRTPDERPGEYHVYQTYVIRCERRDELMKHLLSKGVDAKIHYPTPIHLQEAAQSLGYKQADFPKTLQAISEILSLPLYPGLTQEQQEHVVQSVRSFYV